MVDPEEHPGAAHTTYAAPTLAAQTLIAAILDGLLVRVGNLERALRLVQGRDRQSYQFRDLYFPKVTLPASFHIPEFKKYNGRGCPISHLKAYCSDFAQLQVDEGLLIRLF